MKAVVARRRSEQVGCSVLAYRVALGKQAAVVVSLQCLQLCVDSKHGYVVVVVLVLASLPLVASAESIIIGLSMIIWLAKEKREKQSQEHGSVDEAKILMHQRKVVSIAEHVLAAWEVETLMSDFFLLHTDSLADRCTYDLLRFLSV